MRKSLAIFIGISLCLVYPKPSFAAVATWQKGVSIYPRGPDDFGSLDMQNLFGKIAADNANFVTFVIPYYQGSHTSAKIFPGVDTPTDKSIILGITAAHENGLSVMLKPHLDSDDTVWRANINPKDRDAWFANYENLLLRYAVIGRVYGVEEICIGTELIRVAAENQNPDNTKRWQKIISDLRAVYPGKLTYSANWGPATSTFADEKDHIGFWPDLDFVGISAYFPLNTVSSWGAWDESDIKPLADKTGKPILFTEVGYRSARNAVSAPYDFKKKSVYDPHEQVNAYEALFSYFDSKPYIAGVSMWDFYADPNAGGEGNTDYTPQGKPAEEVLKKWFAQPKADIEATETGGPNNPNFFEELNSRIQNFLRIPLTTVAEIVQQKIT